MKFFNLIYQLKKDKQKTFRLLFGLLFLGYFFLIWSSFKEATSQISNAFGYMDFQSHQRLLEDFVRLKMPFRDYFFEPSYGWFYLLIQSIPYLIFRKTFLAVLIIRNLFLPITGVVLSYFVAKNILKKRYLILLFLFFCFLFRTNYEFPSPRHLIAELSLSFFILYFLKKETKYLSISGVIAGLAVLSSLEYGLALNMAILFIFLVSFLSSIKLRKVFFNAFVLGEMAILIPFYSWLFFKGVLKNYWDYTLGFMDNFYYASPCGGDTFPRLSEITTLASRSRWLIFNLPIEFLQRLNFYFVFVFYAISAIVLFILFIKQKGFRRNDLIKLSLIVYGLLIYLRTLNTPCLSYFVYGLVPFFLLMTLVIGKIISWSWRKRALIFKVIGVLGVMMLISWFVLTERTGYVVKTFGKQEKQREKEFHEKEFYPPVGWYLEKGFVEKYAQITNYIVKNTLPSDFVYVFPWGPYNQLADRPAPNSVPTTIHFLAGEQFMKLARQEIEVKKPKLVVVNLHNNLGTVHWGTSRGDVARYFSLEGEEGPVFSGEGNEIQKYILENYETVLKNDLAAIMEPREKPIIISAKKKEVASFQDWEEEKVELQSMEKTNLPGKYKIIGKKASWSLVLTEPIQAKGVFLEFKLDGNIFTKPLTRYFLNFHLKSSLLGSEEFISKDLARKDWQKVPLLFREERPIRKVKIEIGENTGFIWWFNPDLLEIGKITFFK